MSPRGRAIQAADGLRKRHPAKHSGNVILIVTEGVKTEPGYIRKLREYLRLPALQVEVRHPPATDPMSLVDYAIERKREVQRATRRGMGIAFDEVWVVFDREQIHGDRGEAIPRAIDKAKGHEVRVALSIPCFEFWLLLHFAYTTRPYACCEEIGKGLKEHLPGYRKAYRFDDTLIGRIPGAVSNAERCRQHHEATSGDGNPSSDMDLLVRSLNEATRPHMRLGLPPPCSSLR